VEQFDNDNNGTIDTVATHTWRPDWLKLKLELDTNNNGTIDQTTDYVYETFPDGSPKLVEVRTDNNGDLIVDHTVRNTYNAAKELVVVKTDTTGDGFFNDQETRTYEDGNHVRSQFDFGLQGTIDLTELRAYQDGLVWQVTQHPQEDTDTTNVLVTNIYNASDLIIEVRTDNAPGPVDGVVDSIFRIERNAAGIATAAEQDNNPGVPEELAWRAVYTLDAEGNRVRTETDNLNDGSVEQIITASYDCFQQ
jgi:hypothetical protein